MRATLVRLIAFACFVAVASTTTLSSVEAQGSNGALSPPTARGGQAGTHAAATTTSQTTHNNKEHPPKGTTRDGRPRDGHDGSTTMNKKKATPSHHVKRPQHIKGPADAQPAEEEEEEEEAEEDEGKQKEEDKEEDEADAENSEIVRIPTRGEPDPNCLTDTYCADEYYSTTPFEDDEKTLCRRFHKQLKDGIPNPVFGIDLTGSAQFQTNVSWVREWLQTKANRYVGGDTGSFQYKTKYRAMRVGWPAEGETEPSKFVHVFLGHNLQFAGFIGKQFPLCKHPKTGYGLYKLSTNEVTYNTTGSSVGEISWSITQLQSALQSVLDLEKTPLANSFSFTAADTKNKNKPKDFISVGLVQNIFPLADAIRFEYWENQIATNWRKTIQAPVRSLFADQWLFFDNEVGIPKDKAFPPNSGGTSLADALLGR